MKIKITPQVSDTCDSCGSNDARAYLYREPGIQIALFRCNWCGSLTAGLYFMGKFSGHSGLKAMQGEIEKLFELEDKVRDLRNEVGNLKREIGRTN